MSRMAVWIDRIVLLRPVAALLIALAFSYAAGLYVVTAPRQLRWLLFISLFIGFYAFSIRKPRATIIGMFLFLPFMGLIRRFLIPYMGWATFDPLVVLVPSVLGLMGFVWYYRRYFQGITELNDTIIFKLVRVLMIIHFIQIFNPLQGSLLTGLGGVIFYIIPLLWMFVSREHFDEELMKKFLGLLLFIGCLGALYGLKQIYLGYYPFEEMWIRMAGYNSLNVGAVVRAVSTFTSSNEYAAFLVISLIIAIAYLLRGTMKLKVIAVLSLPLLLYALFMTSQRAPIFMVLATIMILLALNARKGIGRVVTLLGAGLLVILVYWGITNISHNDNDLIAHQVNGLADPFNEEHSTLGLHLDLLVDGFVRGVIVPVGHGLGSTTLAASKLGGNGGSSEVDISNILISDGLIGGIIYLLLIYHIFRAAISYVRSSQKNYLAFSLLGILIASFGSWSIGGNYSTVAIIWICIGFLDRVTGLHSKGQQPVTAMGEGRLG
ncbi:hypothetical protein EBB07_14195 [Paenibacillaceae bacterium]|nr:hypothetical protein EBB07_14195 [Paenibacillaceae bacterium]